MTRVVISPTNVVSFPEGGGHFWVYMQYVTALLRLGCDVVWLERFRSSGDPGRDQCLRARLLERLAPFGMADRTILYETDALEPGVERILEGADLLVNFQYDMSPALLARFRRTALVDIDPGLLQFWISRKQLVVPKHDLYFTTGETVGTEAAKFPDCGIPWVRIRPPVSLEHWTCAHDPQAGPLTTVSAWDAKDWMIDDEVNYPNTKRVAFLPFRGLPRMTRQPLELALFLRTRRDARERRLMERLGWSIRSSRDVADSPLRYREYIRGSRGEFSCAKPSCIQFQNAWVSDRSLCYLASGKPVVVQDTGPSRVLPDGEGMFRFTTLEQAAAAIESMNADYERHSRAARALAETHFDAARVAARILEIAGG